MFVDICRHAYTNGLLMFVDICWHTYTTQCKVSNRVYKRDQTRKLLSWVHPLSTRCIHCQTLCSVMPREPKKIASYFPNECTHNVKLGKCGSRRLGVDWEPKQTLAQATLLNQPARPTCKPQCTGRTLHGENAECKQTSLWNAHECTAILTRMKVVVTRSNSLFPRLFVEQTTRHLDASS